MRPETHRSLTRGVAGGFALAIGAMTGLPAGAGFNDASVAARSTFTAVPDWLAPAVSSQAVGKSHAGSAQYLADGIKQGGSYYVYANVADSGNPARGVSAVAADVSAISTGRTAEPLAFGSYSIEGTTYNYRTAAIAANASLSGTKSYSITSTDGFNPPRVQNYSVTVDNTAPSAADIQTAGDGDGRAEQNETITFTFSEEIDPQSILNGWTGAATAVQVQLIDGNLLLFLGAPDTVRILNSSGSSQLPLGDVRLPGAGYVVGLLGLPGTTMVFSPSTMVKPAGSNAITVTLGPRTAGSPEPGEGGAMTWLSSTTPYDAAGNQAAGDSQGESGSSDREF